jgi:uncharacterized protein YkwD
MATLSAALWFSIAALAPSDLEVRAAQHVTKEFERVGRRAPAQDASLARAARVLARKALSSSATEAVEMASVSEAMADAEGYDPGPQATIVRGSPLDHALASFLGRTDFNLEPASRMGVAAAVKGEQAAIVALLAQRRAELKRFPRTVAKKGTSADLCGELVPPLHSASAYVTQPTGKVEKVPLSLERGSEFCARIEFPSVGRYWLEVIGQGRQGPEVAALFPVDVGGSIRQDSPNRQAEPSNLGDAKRAIVERINAVRKIYGVAPLEPDPTLNAVAQAYAERMGKENFFAHAGPDGSDLRARLEGAGYRYGAAAENLGLAGGPIAAHFSIERSPGHRRNLIEGAFTHVGVGVALVNRSGRAQALVTEVFARPASPAQQRR